MSSKQNTLRKLFTFIRIFNTYITTIYAQKSESIEKRETHWRIFKQLKNPFAENEFLILMKITS